MKHKNSITSIKKAIGHLNKALLMIENDKYCIDILQQINAAKGHLKSTQSKMLDSHLNSCALKAFSTKDEVQKQKVINELINLFKFN